MRARPGLLAALSIVVAGALLIAAAPKADPKDPPQGAPPAGAQTGKEVRVLEITLGGDIVERKAVTMPFGPQPKLLRNYTASLRKAAEDKDIRAVILHLEQPMLSLAQVQELRDALAEVQAAKKKVYCYAELFSNIDYLVACGADEIVATPTGAVGLVGLSAEVMFLKGLLDWAGVEMTVVHAGKHKTLGEPFTKEAMPEAHRKVFNEFLDELYAQFLKSIADGRGITEEQAKALVDGGPYGAAGAQTAKAIDRLEYYDQFLARVGTELGGKVKPVRTYHHLGKKGPDLSKLNIFTLFSSLGPKPDIPKTARPKVVVIYATGHIVPGRGSSLMGEVITAEAIGKALEKAREDDTVKAVVLRIDSPGGAAVTSDVIWREIVRTEKAGKPVVASLSSVAASGGYYIAVAADKIVAHPASVTGSIGVIGLMPNLAGLYKKIGVNVETFRRGKNAGLMSISTGLSEAERKRVEALIQAVYADFVGKAAAGRDMPRDQMLELATGRVWTAAKAKELGLVDQLGGLKDAYDLAIELAGIKGQNVQPVILPREKDFFEMLLSRAAEGDTHLPLDLPSRLPGPLRGAVPSLEVLQALGRVQALALMPYSLLIR
jgi:protease-4